MLTLFDLRYFEIDGDEVEKMTLSSVLPSPPTPQIHIAVLRHFSLLIVAETEQFFVCPNYVLFLFVVFFNVRLIRQPSESQNTIFLNRTTRVQPFPSFA